MFNLNIKTLSFEIAGTKITKRHMLLSIVVLVFTYGLFQDKIDKYIHAMEGNTTTEIFNKKDSIVGPLIVKDIFGEYFDENPIDDFIQQFCDDYKCKSVNVNLFHNGTVTESGFHCRKMSCVSEALRYGEAPMIHKLQDWVTQPFKKKFRKLRKEKSLYLKDLSKDSDPYFRVIIPRFGDVQSLYYVALYDKRYVDKRGRPHFIGYVVYLWEKPTNFSPSELKVMKTEIDRIREFVIDEEKVKR